MMKLDEGRFTQNDFLISNLNNPSDSHDFKTVLSIQQPLFVPSLSPLKEMAVKDAQKSELGLGSGPSRHRLSSFLHVS